MIDPQSGKPPVQILVQFLIPIVLLVCLFAFFTRSGPTAERAGSPRLPSSPAREDARERGPRIPPPSTTSRGPATLSPNCERSGITSRIRAGTSPSAPPRRRACFSSALRGPARRCWQRRRRGADASFFSCRALTSSSHSSASAPPGCATCSERPARPLRRSSSSTSSMRPAANAARASARATTNASRR